MDVHMFNVEEESNDNTSSLQEEGNNNAKSNNFNNGKNITLDKSFDETISSHDEDVMLRGRVILRKRNFPLRQSIHVYNRRHYPIYGTSYPWVYRI